MDKDRFPLSTSREPNPLRPYYIPPSIGSAVASSPSQSTHALRTGLPSASLSDTARDLLPELDLDLKSSAGEAWQNTRTLFDTLVYRYMSILLAQPFDVAKILLQVSFPPSSILSAAPEARKRRRTGSVRRSAEYTTDGASTASARGRDREYDKYEDEEQQDEDESESDAIPDYFSSSASRSRSPRKRRRTPPSTELSPSPTPTPRNRHEHDPEEEYKLRLTRPDSITHIVSSLYNTSGAVGLWRATNCTFLYSALLRTTDSFIRSLLLAVLGLPDIAGPEQSGLAPALGVPGSLGLSGLDLSDSPNALGSLVVVGLSSAIAGLLLAPLDLVRTRLTVTPTSHPPRGLYESLRRLPSVLAPASLWLPTVLSHTVPQIFSAATPLVLRRQLKLTPETSPGLWSLAALSTCVTELFIRLPLETVNRRAQVASIKASEPDLPLIVDAAPYVGVWGTVYSILYVEGETRKKDAKGMVKVRKGQGSAGLVRGWRVGFWGLVGVWGAGALGPGDGKARGEF